MLPGQHCQRTAQQTAQHLTAGPASCLACPACCGGRVQVFSQLSSAMNQMAISQQWRCRQPCRIFPQRPCDTSCLGFWAGQSCFILPLAASDCLRKDPLAC